MFTDPQPKRIFNSVPQSVTSLVAAWIEPSITVLVYLAFAGYFDRPSSTHDILLCLLAFLLSFPGRNRFWSRPLNAAVDIVSSWLVLVAILVVCGSVTRSLALFDPVMLMCWALATPVLQGLVFIVGRQILVALATRPASRRQAVVVGCGALGAKVAAALDRQGVIGHAFLGYFDDRLDGRLDPMARDHLLGSLGEVSAFVRQRGVHEVYVTLPMGSQPRIFALLEQLQNTTASLYFVPDVFGISIIQGRLQDMNGVPVVGLCETPFTGTNQMAKRVCDVVLAGVILVLISPLLAAIALAVKLDSPGPAIFRQRRNGLGGEEIVVYKFRSMFTQDDGANVRQATRQDQRVTRVGAFLRRTSLDELPQFVNVLQGRMSIVGPRPHAVAHNEMYRELIRGYMVRHKVKPGITGWAQINGCRGETETVDKMRSRVELDLEYLRNWSLGLDLQIIARTVKLVVVDRHAY